MACIVCENRPIALCLLHYLLKHVAEKTGEEAIGYYRSEQARRDLGYILLPRLDYLSKNPALAVMLFAHDGMLWLLGDSPLCVVCSLVRRP